MKYHQKNEATKMTQKLELGEIIAVNNDHLCPLTGPCDCCGRFLGLKQFKHYSKNDGPMEFISLCRTCTAGRF